MPAVTVTPGEDGLAIDRFRAPGLTWRPMAWFRNAPPGDPLAVTMTGVKLGDRLLIIGGTHEKLVAQLSLKPGLTGRVCVLDEKAEVSSRAAATAEREGALVEQETAPHTMLPHNEASFDIVVLNHALSGVGPDRRMQIVNEARRVLRTGGRCITIEAAARGGLAALISKGGVAHTDLEQAFSAAGLRAVRTLAEREGLVFVEGRSEEHTSELQSLAYLVCRLLLEKKNKTYALCT